MRSTALILAQAALISLLAIYGAVGESHAHHSCAPLSATTETTSCQVAE